MQRAGEGASLAGVATDEYHFGVAGQNVPDYWAAK